MKLDHYKPIRKFRENLKGVDYIVGDIHGCFSKLKQRLVDIGFNPKVDRLFSVGDLVDRGDESHLALDWLKKPWFNAVAGNHEQMLIEASKEVIDHYVFIINGGGWFVELFNTDEGFEFVDTFSKLPLVIEIQTSAGVVSVLHSQIVGNDYSRLKDDIENHHDNVRNCIQWNREKVETHHMKPIENIKGVRAVVAGHTPRNEPLVLGNYYSIDTGAVFGGKFSILRADTLEFV